MKEKHSKPSTKSTKYISKENVFSYDDDFKKRTLRYSYWRGWWIHHLGLYRAIVFPSHDKQYINQLKETFLSDSNTETLKSLTDEGLWVLQDNRLIEKLKLLQHKTKITFNKAGSHRGKTSPDELKRIVKLDIKSFRKLVDKRLEGKTVQDITKDYPTQAKIWRYYIKPARMILDSFLYDEDSREGWDIVFKCFEAMSIVIGHDYPYSALTLTDKDDNIILLFKTDRLYIDGLSLAIRPPY